MKVLFAGGGTGGHLYPAIAMAAELLRREPRAEVSFAGTARGIEAREVPRLGYRLHLLPARGLKRGVTPRALLANLGVLADFVSALIRAARLIGKEMPDVVVGTGGYASAPVLLAAQLMGRKTLIQEQNAFPGITTRVLSFMATELHLSFEQSRRFIRRRSSVYVTGNPARAFGLQHAASAREAFGLRRELPTLLVFGGSLGARSINNAFLRFYERFSGKVNIIWQTGASDFERVKEKVRPSGTIWVGSYIEQMGTAYAAADLVVCRAGASTIAELTNLGKPAILVPYPYAAGDHQRHNANALAGSGAAVMIDDAGAGAESTMEMVMKLLEDRDALRRMSLESRKQGYPDAAGKLVERIIALSKY